MGLSPEQRDVVRRSIRRARRNKATPRERKALLLAEGVESNYNDDLTAAESDRDSTGALQQRPSQGWGPAGEPLEVDVDQFLSAARKINRKGFKGSAGQLAQAVQRSAFPDRYDQRSGQVEALLRQFGASGGRGGSETTTRTRTDTTPGIDRSADRRQLLASYLLTSQRHQPGGLLELKQGLDATQDTPSRTKTIRENVRTHERARKPSTEQHGGLGTFDGKKVAAWMVPVLQDARERGWKGTITSGYRSDAEQVRIYNSGVRPAAKPKALGGSGSKHSETGFLKGGVDVTDAETLDRILRAKHSRLKFAGAKDRVHFSVPSPDGSY